MAQRQEPTAPDGPTIRNGTPTTRARKTAAHRAGARRADAPLASVVALEARTATTDDGGRSDGIADREATPILPARELPVATPHPSPGGAALFHVPVEALASSPFQQRRGPLRDVSDLAESIYRAGLLHPIKVCVPSATTRARHPEARFEIQSGHRRLAALTLLRDEGRTRDRDAASCAPTLVPVLIDTEDSPMRSRLQVLAANLHHLPLTAYEEAVGIAEHYEDLKRDNADASYADLAKALGIPRTRAFNAVKVAHRVDEATLRFAGCTTGAGQIDWSRVGRLNKTTLLDAANAVSQRARIAVLTEALAHLPADETGDESEHVNASGPSGAPTTPAATVARVASRRPPPATRSPSGVVRTYESEYLRLRDHGNFAGRFRKRPRDFSDEEASDKLTELLPAVALLAEKVKEREDPHVLFEVGPAVVIALPAGLRGMSELELERVIAAMRAVHSGEGID